MIRMKVCSTKILTELGKFGFTDYQVAGFFFYLGYCINRYAISEGLFSRKSSDENKMNEYPTSFLLWDEHEIEDNQFDSEVVRICFVTFAKVIQEDWFKNEAPLSTFINIGPNYLFTDEINDEIWSFNEGKNFIGKTIDDGYLHFFETVGNDLYDQNITEINDCIWYGRDLFFASVMDDQESYNYVVDKINTLLPPCLQIFLYYPYEYWTSSFEFARPVLFTKVFKSVLNLESNNKIRDRTIAWYQKTILDESGNLLADFEFKPDSSRDLLMRFAGTAFEFKNTLSSEDFEEIFNKPTGFDLDVIGQVIELSSYAFLINEIVRLNFGYDFSKKNWANRGMMMQFYAFYFKTAVRFSVYPKDVILN